jgi:predicted TIM-barrel fold metal-dependent hydrolase
MAQGAPQRIDVHHHILPPFYLQEAGKEIRATAPGFPQLFDWTPEKTLADMDAHSVATAVLSMSTPGIWFGDRDQGRSLARRCNEYAVKMRAEHPGRFGLFAALPLPDVAGSLLEIDYALGTLKADGIGLLTSYKNSWLGDEAYAPVFDELNRRKAVVFVHPNVPDCCTATLPMVAQGLIELLFDTTRAITGLLYSGTFARCPDIRFIFCHGGGGLAQMADRIGNGARNPALAAKVPNGVMHELKKLYLDVANMTGPRAFAAVRDLVGMEKMLLGSDFPFNSIGPTVKGLGELNLLDSELRAIERENALSLLPSLRR